MKETVYEHVDGNDTFTVTAAERWSVGMIRRLKDKYPDQVEIIKENEDGSIFAHVPSSWMRIKPKRHVDISDERREELREQLKAARETRFGLEDGTDG